MDYCQSAPLSIATDKEALISFKSLMSLQSTNPLSSWDQNLSPCNWTGVLCDSPGNRVIALNLSGFGLAGSISPQIGNLSFLRSLELQNNQLRGALPTQMSDLFRLRVLNLSFNSLEAFPSSLLQILDPQLLPLMGNSPDNEQSTIKLNCLTTIFGVGLSCTSASPDGRITMRDTLRKLKTVKDTLVNNCSPVKKMKH
ncbi:hypothetical protein CCACVL1_14080 [Corchorus capsularis]|uniref:Leucine-rich repeat-containing N-terminal plant-type domain-containing protein n=1 Tax=Corchorus capsularis TaxID=210143 RepID=A0A1R3I8G2_COCAP|nr:hypothetical protein CCACVL1_14080 [Corchorus capsularis]